MDQIVTQTRLKNFPLNKYLQQDFEDFVLLLSTAQTIAQEEAYKAEDLSIKGNSEQQKQKGRSKLKQFNEYRNKCERLKTYLTKHIQGELNTNSGPHSFIEFLDMVKNGIYLNPERVLMKKSTQNNPKEAIIHILLNSKDHKMFHSELMDILSQNLKLNLKHQVERNKCASAITYCKHKTNILLTKDGDPDLYTINLEHKSVKRFLEKNN